MEFTYHKLSLQAIVEKAATQDRLFVTRIANRDSQNQVVSKFETLSNEGRNNKNKPFCVVQRAEPAPYNNNNDSNDDNNHNSTHANNDNEKNTSIKDDANNNDG